MFKPELSTSVGYVVGKGLKDGEYLYALDPAVKKDLRELKAAGINSVELDVCGMHYAWAFEKLLKSSLREGAGHQALLPPEGSVQRHQALCQEICCR